MITPTAFRFLECIAEHPGCTRADAVQMLGYRDRQTSVGNTTKPLVVEGLVRPTFRNPYNGKFSGGLYLTEKGMKVLGFLRSAEEVLEGKA